MTVSLKVQKTMEKDGEMHLSDIPFKKGEKLEVIIRSIESYKEDRPTLTARKLLELGLTGMWKDRKDLRDSSIYARNLREQAQCRDRGN